MGVILCAQAEKQKQREEQEKRLLEQRAMFIEKTKSLLHFDPIPDEKPKKSSKVGMEQGLW